jgi:flagellar export protein FliJ
MKHFVFRLASVLTLRLREEERAQQVFGKAVQLRNQAALALEQSRTALDACYAALTAGRTGATNRTEQILLLSSLQQQQAHGELLATRLAAADRDVAARRGDFLIARRKREALTKLRERQHIAHRLAQERAAEAEVADLITARHMHTVREVAA